MSIKKYLFSTIFQSEISEIHKTIDRQNVTISEQAETIKTLKKSEQSLSKQSSSQKLIISDLENINSELNKSERRLQKIKEKNELTINKKDWEIQELKTANEILTDSTETLNITMSKKDEIINELKKTCDTLLKSANSLKKTITKKDKEIQVLNELVDSLGIESAELTKTIAIKDEKIIALYKEGINIQNKNNEHKQQIEEQINEINTLLDAKNQLGLELLKREQEVEEYTSSHASQLSTIRELSEKVESLTKLLESSDSKNKELSAALSEANITISQNKDLISTTTAQKNDLAELYESARETNSELEEEILNLKSTIEEKEKTNQELKLRIKSIEDKNKDQEKNKEKGSSSPQLHPLPEEERSPKASSYSSLQRLNHDLDIGLVNSNSSSHRTIYTKHTNSSSSPLIQDFPIIENENIYSNTERSIAAVYDNRNNRIIDANSILDNYSADEISRLRLELEGAVRDNIPYYSCPSCGNKLKISSRTIGSGDNKREIQFFTHAVRNLYCEFKREHCDKDEEYWNYKKTYSTEQFNNMRKQIFQALSSESELYNQISEVKERIYIESDKVPFTKRRLADISAKYREMNLIFEIVTPVTSLAHINDLDVFYSINQNYIFWIFGLNSITDYLELSRSVAKDIIFTNKRNVFVFDTEARIESERQGKLILKCNWLDTDNNWHYRYSKNGANGILISLDDLIFEHNYFRPYYYDADKESSTKYPSEEQIFFQAGNGLEEKLVEAWKYYSQSLKVDEALLIDSISTTTDTMESEDIEEEDDAVKETGRIINTSNASENSSKNFTSAIVSNGQENRNKSKTTKKTERWNKKESGTKNSTMTVRNSSQRQNSCNYKIPQSNYELRGILNDRDETYKIGVSYEMKIVSITEANGGIESMIVQDRVGRKLRIYGGSLNKRKELRYLLRNNYTIILKKIGYNYESRSTKWQLRY